MARKKVICAICEGKNVSRDARASWDFERQEWLLKEVYEEDAFCYDCDDFVILKKVEESQEEHDEHMFRMMKRFVELMERQNKIAKDEEKKGE